VTHGIADRLVTDYGHHVSALAINYRGDPWPTPIDMYVPTLGGGEIYGFSRVVEVLGIVEPDVVVILNDPQVVVKFLFNNRHDEQRLLLGYRPIIAYLPIDGHGQPPGWEVLKKTTKRVAMTKFGQAVMPEAELVYHGVDSKLYRPVTERAITVSNGAVLRTKRDCKAAFGFDPDGFLVLRVDRNSLRKGYSDSVKALWPFMERHADVQAHLHCVQGDTAGVTLQHMLNRRTELKKRFFFPDNLDTFEGWTDNDLCALYNAADVFLSTSWGEGFGLTLAEAAACGVPVIAQDVSAIPEVVGPGGILIAPQREFTVPSGEEQWLPDVAAFTDALETIYANTTLRRRLGREGREHVQRSFSWDVAARRFHDFIVELATPSDPQEEVTLGSDEVQHLVGSGQDLSA
jgi:glycosyltransferase involved in cell wall biosynthesis